MKARELAEILLMHPENEVIISADTNMMNAYGMPVEQVVKEVQQAVMTYIPVDGRPFVIVAKNHPITETGQYYRVP